MEIRTFFSSELLRGRRYGEPAATNETFTVVPLEGRPLLAWSDDFRWWKHLTNGLLLVQLDERPDTLWLARAVTINDVAMIRYVPVETLVALDGTLLPVLPMVPLEQVLAAQRSAEETRQAQRRDMKP